MYRFDPRRFAISMHAGNSPNPHGTSFDYWGYHYATDGTGGRAYQVRPSGTGFKMTELLKKEVRPVTASEVVSCAHFPESMQGDFLICNVIGFLGIKHYRLDRNATTGAIDANAMANVGHVNPGLTGNALRGSGRSEPVSAPDLPPDHSYLDIPAFLRRQAD